MPWEVRAILVEKTDRVGNVRLDPGWIAMSTDTGEVAIEILPESQPQWAQMEADTRNGYNSVGLD